MNASRASTGRSMFGTKTLNVGASRGDCLRADARRIQDWHSAADAALYLRQSAKQGIVRLYDERQFPDRQRDVPARPRPDLNSGSACFLRKNSGQAFPNTNG